MSHPLRMLTAELEGDDGLIVSFSDGKTTAYVVEELLELRQRRETTENPKLHKAGELLRHAAVLESGALRGMELEARCDVLACKQSSDLGSDYAWASIVNAPAELPDGEYLAMFDGHTVQVAKARGLWVCARYTSVRPAMAASHIIAQFDCLRQRLLAMVISWHPFHNFPAICNLPESPGMTKIQLQLVQASVSVIRLLETSDVG